MKSWPLNVVKLKRIYSEALISLQHLCHLSGLQRTAPNRPLIHPHDTSILGVSEFMGVCHRAKCLLHKWKRKRRLAHLWPEHCLMVLLPLHTRVILSLTAPLSLSSEVRPNTPLHKHIFIQCDQTEVFILTQTYTKYLTGCVSPYHSCRGSVFWGRWCVTALCLCVSAVHV